jgi:L-fuculose-phosphate aldolase
MARIYKNGMTTTSGGNLSIIDSEGSVWITPSRVDKGTLTKGDIVRVMKDGTVDGKHKPSSEYPFHRKIYDTRPDIKAVMHVHMPSFSAFCAARKAPDTRIHPKAHDLCGDVAVAPYALPGSDLLADSIADCFAKGARSVLMESHGAVIGMPNLQFAFEVMETLEYTCRLLVQATVLGKPHTPTSNEIKLMDGDFSLPTMPVKMAGCREMELRQALCDFAKRGYSQKLIISTEGTLSVRLDENSFLITPRGKDRFTLATDDIVLVRDGKAEEGKRHSKAAKLHGAVYKLHPHINAIINAVPINATSFAVTDPSKFDSRVIPESYILLRDVPVCPYGKTLIDEQTVAKMFSKDTPMLLVKNDGLMVTGGSLLEAFDRLEVAEATANLLVQAKIIGGAARIDDKDIDDIIKHFLS